MQNITVKSVKTFQNLYIILEFKPKGVTVPRRRMQKVSFSSLFFSCQAHTDTWGQLVLLTTILNHKICINTSRHVLEKTLFAINAIFTQDNNLSKKKEDGSLQKTNATCSKCKTNLILTYLHRSGRHSSSQSQKSESTILSDENKLLPNISSVNEIFGPTQCCPMVPC